MNANLYETDHAAWLERQTTLLKSGHLAELDIEHLAEELEWAMGNERREIYQRLRILMGHLLKWQHQPAQHSASWAGTIRVQRKDLGKLLKDNPSLLAVSRDGSPGRLRGRGGTGQFRDGYSGSGFPRREPLRPGRLAEQGFLA